MFKGVRVIQKDLLSACRILPSTVCWYLSHCLCHVSCSTGCHTTPTESVSTALLNSQQYVTYHRAQFYPKTISFPKMTGIDAASDFCGEVGSDPLLFQCSTAELPPALLCQVNLPAARLQSQGSLLCLPAQQTWKCSCSSRSLQSLSTVFFYFFIDISNCGRFKLKALWYLFIASSVLQPTVSFIFRSALSSFERLVIVEF